MATPQSESGPFIGTNTPRVDGRAKVSGATQYVDDHPIDGAWYGRTLRSTIPHGTFESLHFDQRFDWSDVHVATADDLSGPNYVALIERDQPVLVPIGGTIKHVDEPLAIVAAPTKQKVAAALANLSARVTAHSPILSLQDSLSCHVVIHGDDNVFKRIAISQGGDIQKAFTHCDHIIEGIYSTGAQEQMYIEPQGIVAWWQGPSCHVLGSMQCPYFVHRALKEIYCLEDDHVVVKQAATGGGFGGKEEYPSMLACHATLIARKANRPVKMIYDRGEDIRATSKRHPSHIRHRLGIMNDGTVHAIDVDLLFDGGAYLTLSPVVLSRAVLHAAGPYKCPHVRIQGRILATNHPPHGAFRGFGAPQCTFAYARQMQKASRLLRMDAAELHRLNMLRVGDHTATGQRLTHSVASDKVLAAIAQRSQLAPPRDRRMAKSNHVARGRGLCFYFHGAGFSGNREERVKGKVAVALTMDGKFEVRSAATDIGQGSRTIFSQLAASELGVDLKYVDICDADTHRVPDSGPTVASRTCMVVGSLVQNAARQVREELHRFAVSEGLDVTNILDVATNWNRLHGELEKTVAYQAPQQLAWDANTFSGDAYPCFGWAAVQTDIAVDLDTYEVTIERLIHAVDVGKAINPVIVRGQIEGATLQALGWALCERVSYQDGQVANSRMADCIIPSFVDAPEMETLIIEEPFDLGPHGAKGVGEIPIDGPAASIAGALEDALGVPFDEVPMLPENIAHALSKTPHLGEGP